MVERGIYALLIYAKEQELSIGALGRVHFSEGYYVYVGSAQRNLPKRIERHRRKYKRHRWHIDYLLDNAELVDVYAAKLEKSCEERVAMWLEEIYDYVPRFGASDSHAKSHLFYSVKENIWHDAISLIERCMPDD